jgi:hypothetical protein
MSLQKLDFICFTITCVALFLIPKSYKFWLLYSFACLCYLYVRVMSGFVGSAMLEVIAGIVGIFNYFKIKQNH